MENVENDKTILNNFGGILKNNLINVMDNQDDENSIQISDSHFVKIDEMPEYIESFVDGFSVLSINIQSIGSDGKFEILKCILNELQYKGIIFSAICIQESWIKKPRGNNPNNEILNLFEIPGYEMFPLYATCSSHGGLITYVREEYDTSALDLNDSSRIWEGQFFKISGCNLDRPLTLCNLYKPPINNNNNVNIQNFMNEFSPRLESVIRSNTDVVTAGDLNIDLLKIKERALFSDYLDLYLGYGLLPQISIPTRFSRKNATLLDHIFSKFKKDPSNCKSKSGVLFTKISDHMPTFTFHKIVKPKRQFHPKYISKQTTDENAIKNFNEAFVKANILDHIDLSSNACPDRNYTIFENILTRRNTYQPKKLSLINISIKTLHGLLKVSCKA